jgi:hypothetical protein
MSSYDPTMQAVAGILVAIFGLYLAVTVNVVFGVVIIAWAISVAVPNIIEIIRSRKK